MLIVNLSAVYCYVLLLTNKLFSMKLILIYTLRYEVAFSELSTVVGRLCDGDIVVLLMGLCDDGFIVLMMICPAL